MSHDHYQGTMYGLGRTLTKGPLGFIEGGVTMTHLSLVCGCFELRV